MMKINSIFVIAAAYGLGILTSYRFFRNRERERADAEIKSVIDHFTNKDNGSGQKKKETEGTNQSSGERNSLDSGQKVYDRVNYAVHSMPFDSAEAESPKEEEPEETNNDNKEAHEITMEEYFALTGVEKRSLRWYTENDVLTVEDSENEDITPNGLIDDEHTILGDVLEKSRFKVDEWIDVIYIFNPVISCAYEVSKTYGKYEF